MNFINEYILTISTFLSVASMIHLWLMVNKWKWAPLVGIILQLVWVYFAFAEKQHGFLIGSVGFMIVHIRNHIKWTKPNDEFTEFKK